jgi:ferredoxin--NADP+ reductase
MTAAATTPASDLAAADAALLNATVSHREDLTPELTVVRVRPDGEVPEYKPGQYATLGMPPLPGSPQAASPKKGLGRFVLRPYSISSSPLDRDGIEFYVARVDGGAFTPLLWDVPVGGRLYMAPKCKGKFTLDGIPPDRDLVTVATGTGLAPFVSMLRTYRDTGRWRNFVFLHGVRKCGDLGYRNEIEDVAAADPTVRYAATCSREGDDYTGIRGRVDRLVDEVPYREATGLDLTPEHCHVLLCGNPGMIDGVTQKLVARGFVPKDRQNPDGNIHFEKYW